MLTCLDQGAGCLHSVWLMRQPSQTPSFFATLLVHTHPFDGPLSGTTRLSRYQKVKTVWILLNQETVSGSSISWAICKQSAPHSSNDAGTPPQFFYRLDALPAAQLKGQEETVEQETVSGSGISWAICKSAPRSRQITTPAPHHSVFLQAGCPSCRRTNSVKALKAHYR